MKNILSLFIIVATLMSCETSKLNKIDKDQFLGQWRLNRSGITDKIQFEIKKKDNGELYGEIIQLNDNKYVQLFMEEGDQFVKNIKRSSNYEFTISESRIAAPLFSAYGQNTTDQFKATFDGEHKILLGKNGADGVYHKINLK